MFNFHISLDYSFKIHGNCKKGYHNINKLAGTLFLFDFIGVINGLHTPLKAVIKTHYKIYKINEFR